MANEHPVVHFEMPYDNADRVAEFYRKAFDWEMQLFGEEMGNYVLAGTCESDNGRPTAPGAINGGFFPKSADMPAQVPSVVIATDDIQASMKAVTAAGGEVLGEPMPIPGVGLYVSFYDTERNRASLLQPAGM